MPEGYMPQAGIAYQPSRPQAGYGLPTQGDSQGYAAAFTGQTFASLSLSDSQPGFGQFPQGYSQGNGYGYSQGDSQGGGVGSANGYNLSLSQDFALTSSQEELYRFGEVWGAGPA